MENNVPLMKALREILDDHPLACECVVCMALNNGKTLHEGMMQAADVLRHQRDTGVCMRPN